MRFISPKVHGCIDYLAVIFLFAAPTIFEFTGVLANFTYVLGAAHFMLTIFTDFNAGLIKVISFQLHGLIEFVVGVTSVVLSFTLFENNEGRLFYSAFGSCLLVTCLFTKYTRLRDIRRILAS